MEQQQLWSQLVSAMLPRVVSPAASHRANEQLKGATIKLQADETVNGVCGLDVSQPGGGQDKICPSLVSQSLVTGRQQTPPEMVVN